MKHTARLNLVMLLLLVAPGVAFGQRDTRETQEANKFIALAMTRQDSAAKADMYRQAMDQLRPAMTSDADNAQVWLLAGTALVALGQMQEADEAFDRAVQLHPDYAADIDVERETGWVEAFNRGIELMDAGQYPEAIAAMEAAQTIYDRRPEALMNLGALYANGGEYVDAERALQAAIVATQGPMFAELEADQQAEWLRFRTMATSNIAQIQAQQGIQAFEAEQFDSAAARFMRAAETNPQARDYWFNYGQALWAMSTSLEQSLETASAADSAAAIERLHELYAGIQTTAGKVREFDPNNEVLYLMEARTHRMIGDLGPEAQQDAKHQEALRLLEAHDALTVTLDGVSALQDEAGGVRINGMLKNIKAPEGATVTVRFTLLDPQGSALGTHDITVTVPAADQTVPFESSAPIEGDLAGWKYTVS